MMTCSSDGSLRVWDLETGKQISNWRDGESGVPVWAIALSPDGKKVVSGSEDGAVRMWDVDIGKVIAKWTGNTGSVSFVCWSRDGGRVMSGCGNGTVRVWDVESGRIVLEIETGLNEMRAAIYSPDTTKIVTCGHSKEKEFIKIWDANTGKLVTKLKGHTKKVTCLAWNPDGTTLISGSNDNSIRTWNTTTWQQVAALTTDSVFGIFAIAIFSNGRILASASYLNPTVQLWNLENGQHISLPLQHESMVYSMSLSTDGKILATTCLDNNLYTWDISAFVGEAGHNELLFNTDVS
jgi:tricorn protease-like protein